MPDPLALDHQTVRAVNGPSACFLRRESQEDHHVLQKTIENWKLDALVSNNARDDCSTQHESWRFSTAGPRDQVSSTGAGSTSLHGIYWHSLYELNGSLALPNRRSEDQNQVDASALGRWTAALDLAVFSGAPSNMVASVRFVKLVRVIVRWATLSRRRPRRRPKMRDHPRGGQVTPWRQASRRHNRSSELAGAVAAHETGLRRVKPPADLVNHPLLRSCTNLTQDLPSKACKPPSFQDQEVPSVPTPACKPVVEAQPVAVFRLAAPVMQLAC
ncbi:hypothetical protein VDGL01_08396 [Verticillium dahliae]